MASYANGEQTRKTMIQSAKKLIWEQGYKKTKCSDISEDSASNPGLIHYYFKNKGNIAAEIYTDIMNQIIDTVSRTYSWENVLFRKIVAYRICWYLLSEYKEFRNFLCDIIPEHIAADAEGKHVSEFRDKLREAFPGTLSSDGLYLALKCFIASDNELILAYNTDEVDLTSEEMAVTGIVMLCRLLGLSDEEMKDYVERTKLLADKFNIQMKAGFELSIEKKKIG